MIATLITAGIFGLLILIHELGHFLIARLFKVRVDIFSIGFGPKLWQKKIGNTVYCISAIPLGGYVKLAGEEKEEGKQDEFRSKPSYVRIAIILAGVSFNFIFAYLLLTSYYFLIGNSFISSLQFSAGLIKDVFVVTFQTLWEIVTSKLSIKETIGGPVALGSAIHAAKNYTLEFLLATTALVSLVVGIFNTLPLPVLDGGAVVFIFLEKIIGKNRTEKLQNILQLIFFILLIGLTIFVFYNDIARIVMQ